MLEEASSFLAESGLGGGRGFFERGEGGGRTRLVSEMDCMLGSLCCCKFLSSGCVRLGSSLGLGAILGGGVFCCLPSGSLWSNLLLAATMSFLSGFTILFILPLQETSLTPDKNSEIM